VDQAGPLDLTDERHDVVHLGRTTGEGPDSSIEPLYKFTRRALLLASDEVQRALGAKHGAIDVLRLLDPVRQQQDRVSVL
jgi:hypothetical protein